MKKVVGASPVQADPEQWSEKGKRSISYQYTREYVDIHYVCWRCTAASVFTAKDQKHTFEVKKASIDQRRILCSTCWSESNQLRARLAELTSSWAVSKKELQRDERFLRTWLELLIGLEEYVPYKPDAARKRMILKLLAASEKKV